MYLSFFSLQRKPFELLPNPNFLFLSDIHKKALTFLEYGLMENTGFILFTGEVGTGKTTIIKRLLTKISKNITVATIFNTQVSSTQLLKMINMDFGIASTSDDKAVLLHELNEFLIDQYASGLRSVLIVDEAQNLDFEQLEEIRLLSNLETPQSKLLQIILVGQPELREKIARPELIQLRQRILVHSHLSSLDVESVSSYIYHRLEQAGNRNAINWEDGCMELIHESTRGVPRLINILCDYILLSAYTKNQKFANPQSVELILKQLDFEAQFWGSELPEETEKNCESKDNKSENAQVVVDSSKWSTDEVNKLCDRMETCVEMMQQSLVSLSQVIVLLSQQIAAGACNNLKAQTEDKNGGENNDKLLL